MNKREKWVEFLKGNETIFRQVIGDNFRLLVVDPDLVIVFFRDYNSQIAIELSEGKKLPEDSSSGLALRTRQTVKRIVPKDVFGVEIQTISIPFEDNSGCLNIVYNISTAYKISNALEQIVASTEEIASSSQVALQQTISMDKQFDNIMSSIEITVQETKKLLGVYALVKSIADNLRLISINALIEAAHAKEHGRGFSVVASEVRKLAEQTAKQMDEVSAIIHNITRNEENAIIELESFRKFLKDQDSISSEITQAIDTVASSTQDLQKITNLLLRLDE